jgi:hypothetical protein
MNPDTLAAGTSLWPHEESRMDQKPFGKEGLAA